MPDLWYGDFSSGTISKTLYPVQSAVAGHALVVPDPLGSGHKVLELAVADSDRPYVGASNPRADFESPGLFKPGSDLYISIPILIPKGYPLIDWHKGWHQVAEVYGPPHGGSPPLGVNLFNDGVETFNRFMLQDHSGHVWWKGPALDGRWHTVTLHPHFATDSTGSVEVFYDGVLQKLTNGATKANYANLLSGVNWNGVEANYLNINSYRQAGAWPGTLMLYHGAPVVATSLAP